MAQSWNESDCQDRNDPFLYVRCQTNTILMTSLVNAYFDVTIFIWWQEKYIKNNFNSKVGFTFLGLTMDAQTGTKEVAWGKNVRLFD